MKINQSLITLLRTKTTALILLAGISIYGYGEKSNEIIGASDSYETDDSLLETFMRDHHKLEVNAAALGINIKDENEEILSNLPYRSLYLKLQNKLLNLALLEAENSASQKDLAEAMQDVMNELSTGSGGGLNRVILSYREKLKNYPNTSDLISLTATSIFNAMEIAELTHTLKENNPKTKNPDKSLLIMMFNNEIDNYKNFITRNKKALEIISKLADDDFKFEDTLIEYISFQNKEQHKVEKNINEIKNFSEIMPYVIAIQKKRNSIAKN